MNLPKIIEEKCADNAATDPSCNNDIRCDDPIFAAANPLLCSNSQSIEIRPGFQIVCAEGNIEFTTWLRNGSSGQTQLTDGLTYASSDESILVVDPQTGVASAVGPGIATVAVTWGGMSSAAQITVVGDEVEDCCSEVTVQLALVMDKSQSMGQPFNLFNIPGGPMFTKQFAAGVLADGIIATFSLGRNAFELPMCLISFEETAVTAAELGSTLVEIQTARYGVITTDKKTNLPAGFEEALTALDWAGTQAAGTQNAIVIISDGATRPQLTSAEVTAFVGKVDAFKASGGVVIAIGIRAVDDGFTMMQRIATDGFFINVNDAAFNNLDTVSEWIANMMCMFCGQLRVDDYTVCGTLSTGPQVPDPDPLPDIESGETDDDDDDGGGGPKLPKPVFDPASGTSAAPFDVEISVPNHPNAHIRFTLKQDGTSPANPSFTYPSDPATGLDYDGQNVPVSIEAAEEPWMHARLKAIARETGFSDSDVAEVEYPAGASNNSDPITINDAPVGQLGKATTYPSVKYVTGVVGNITEVTAELDGFGHTWPADCRILLVSPAGTKVVLMAKCGGSTVVAGLNLVFDDDAASEMPENTPLLTGTYKPTNHLPQQSPPFPSPAPAAPYESLMSAFDGEDPNGAWTLWVVDAAPLNTGTISAGWDLTITAA